MPVLLLVEVLRFTLLVLLSVEVFPVVLLFPEVESVAELLVEVPPAVEVDDELLARSGEVD